MVWCVFCYIFTVNIWITGKQNDKQLDEPVMIMIYDTSELWIVTIDQGNINIENHFTCQVPEKHTILEHYSNAVMTVMASQITSLTIVYACIYWGTGQRKHQSSASQAFVRGIHRWQMNSPQKEPVTRKMFSFDDVIMYEMWNWFHWNHALNVS